MSNPDWFQTVLLCLSLLCCGVVLFCAWFTVKMGNYLDRHTDDVIKKAKPPFIK